MGVSKNRGTQQLLVFLLKMTILGCFGGTTILGNPRILDVPHAKNVGGIPGYDAISESMNLRDTKYLFVGGLTTCWQSLQRGQDKQKHGEMEMFTNGAQQELLMAPWKSSWLIIQIPC